MEATSTLVEHMLDPKHLWTYAFSLIHMVVHGDAGQLHEGQVELSAHPQHEPTEKVITELGLYPVAELTPEEKASGLTAVEKGFGYTAPGELDAKVNDFDTDLTNDSNLMKSARATLIAQGLSGVELEQAMDQVRGHIKDFIAASHQTTIGDQKHPFSQNGVTDVYIKDGKMIMADGTLTAKEVTLKLKEPAEGSQLLITTTDAQGNQHTNKLTIFDKCANPAVQEIKVEPAAPAAPAPEAPCTPEGKTVSRDLYVGAKSDPDEIGYPKAKPHEVVPVVRVEDMTKDGVWKDTNGDGDKFCEDSDSRLGIGFDKDEIFPGITKERIQEDVDAFRAAGYRGEAIFYQITDCDGNTYVACWDIKKEEWGVAYPDDYRGNPINVPGERGNVFATLTGKDLDMYLRGSVRTPVVVK